MTDHPEHVVTTTDWTCTACGKHMPAGTHAITTDDGATYCEPCCNWALRGGSLLDRIRARMARWLR